MPSATAQLESSGEETQHPDNGTGYRGLSLRLNLGKLTAQLMWRLTIIWIQVFPQKGMGLMSHCGPSSLTDLVILWLPISLGIRGLCLSVPRQQGKNSLLRQPGSRECLAEAGNPLFPPAFPPWVM